MENDCGESEDCTAKCCQPISQGARALKEKSRGLCPIDVMIVADRSGSIVCRENEPDFCAADVRKTIMAVFEAVTNNLNNPENKEKSRVGLVTFSDGAHLQLSMATHSVAAFKAHVEREISCADVTKPSCKLRGRTNHGAGLGKAFDAMRVLAPVQKRKRLVVLITDGATTVGPKDSELTLFVSDSLQKMDAARRPLVGVVMVGNERLRVCPDIASMVTDAATGRKSRFYYSSDSFDASDVIYDLLDKACEQKEEDVQTTCQLWKESSGCPFATKYAGPDETPCGLLASKAASFWKRPACCSRKDRLVHTVKRGETLASITRQYCITMDEFINENNGRVSSAAYVTPMTDFNIPPPGDLCNSKRPYVDCAQKCCKDEAPTCDTIQCDAENGWTARHPPGTKCTAPDLSDCYNFCCKPPEPTPGDCDKPLVGFKFPEPADDKGNCVPEVASKFPILSYRWGLRKKQNVELRRNEKRVHEASGLECVKVTESIDDQTETISALRYTDPLADWGWMAFPREYAAAAKPGNVLMLVHRTSAPLGCLNVEVTTDKDGKAVCKFANGKQDMKATWGEDYRGSKNYKNLADVVVTIGKKMYGYKFPERLRFNRLKTSPDMGPDRFHDILKERQQVTPAVRHVIPFGALAWQKVTNKYKENAFVLSGPVLTLRSVLKGNEVPSQLLIRVEYVTGDWGFKRVPEQHVIFSADVCPEDSMPESDSKCVKYFGKCASHNMGKKEDSRNRLCLDDVSELEPCKCPTPAAYQAKKSQNLRCEHAFVGAGLSLACIKRCVQESAWTSAKCDEFDPDEWSCKKRCCSPLSQKLCVNHECAADTRKKSPLPELCGTDCQSTCCSSSEMPGGEEARCADHKCASGTQPRPNAPETCKNCQNECCEPRSQPSQQSDGSSIPSDDDGGSSSAESDASDSSSGDSSDGGNGSDSSEQQGEQEEDGKVRCVDFKCPGPNDKAGWHKRREALHDEVLFWPRTGNEPDISLSTCNPNDTKNKGGCLHRCCKRNEFASFQFGADLHVSATPFYCSEYYAWKGCARTSLFRIVPWDLNAQGVAPLSVEPVCSLAGDAPRLGKCDATCCNGKLPVYPQSSFCKTMVAGGLIWTTRSFTSPSIMPFHARRAFPCPRGRGLRIANEASASEVKSINNALKRPLSGGAGSLSLVDKACCTRTVRTAKDVKICADYWNLNGCPAGRESYLVKESLTPCSGNECAETCCNDGEFFRYNKFLPKRF